MLERQVGIRLIDIWSLVLIVFGLSGVLLLLFGSDALVFLRSRHLSRVFGLGIAVQVFWTAGRWLVLWARRMPGIEWDRDGVVVRATAFVTHRIPWNELSGVSAGPLGWLDLERVSGRSVRLFTNRLKFTRRGARSESVDELASQLRAVIEQR